MKRFLLCLTAALALLGTSSCNFNNLNTEKLMSAGTKAAQAAMLSDDQIAQYISQYVQYMDAQNRVLPASDPYSKRLARVTESFTSVDGVPLNFKVYRTNEVNAFACADGSVRVYTGLMDCMTDDEFRGVIGHEIGHVAHHDTRKAFKNALMTSALRDVVGSTDGIVGELTNSQLGDLGEQLLSAKYSRKQETNADDYSYNFLKSHGYNPWALVDAFTVLENLQSQNGAPSGGLMNLFSSHPDTEARIRDIATRCQKDGIPRPASRK